MVTKAAASDDSAAWTGARIRTEAPERRCRASGRPTGLEGVGTSALRRPARCVGDPAHEGSYGLEDLIPERVVVVDRFFGEGDDHFFEGLGERAVILAQPGEPLVLFGHPAHDPRVR